MTKEEAMQNIGKPFKSELFNAWDTINAVTDDGVIIGDFMEADASDCRLKQPQPEALRKYRDGDDCGYYQV